MEKYSRKCPECRTELTYSTKGSMTRAMKKNDLCISCCRLGERHHMFGKNHTEESNRKNSEANKRVIRTEEWKNKIRQSLLGHEVTEETRQKMRRPKSKEHIKKLRLSAIRRIEQKHGQIMPNYNPNVIPIIEQKAKEFGITDLIHAENGGEFQVAGYFVDGYSSTKNIVIEYYEPFHKNQVERDKRRKQEIIEHLNCEFIEIREYE